MGLEGADHPLVPQGAGGIQQGLQLAGVVGVVVKDLRPMEAALVLQAAARPPKGVQPLLHRPGGDPQGDGRGGGGQGVFHIVNPRHPQGYMGKGLPPVHHVEGGQAPFPDQTCRVDVPRLQAKGGDGAALPLQGAHGVGVVPVGNDAPALGHQVGKAPEGVLHILQILEKVQVVRLDVQDDRHRGEEGQKGVAVLAGLQDDGLPPAHPVSRPQQGQSASDHHRGVQSGGHDDVGAHGGGGSLSVGARDAQGVAVMLHDGAPGLGPLKDGDARLPGGGDLGVDVVDGGGADDQLGPRHVLRPVAYGDVDTQGAQMLHCGAVVHIGAGDDHARTVEDFRQRGHGYAADAHQVGPAAGLDVIVNVQNRHGVYTPFV